MISFVLSGLCLSTHIKSSDWLPGFVTVASDLPDDNEDLLVDGESISLDTVFDFVGSGEDGLTSGLGFLDSIL